MPGPHPGKWQVVEQNAQVNATHACLLRTGKVLYFRAWGTPYESRIWNPTTGQITTQVIPPWPAPKNSVDPPGLFCSGHCFLPDGRVLIAGGDPEPPDPDPLHQFKGLKWTYIFDPVAEAWTPAGTAGNPHAMADGRWYPAITAIGEPRVAAEKVIAMSGFRRQLVGGQSVVNEKPERYNPDPLVGWTTLPPEADIPTSFRDLYPGAHVIPYGTYAGELFYSEPNPQAWRFKHWATGNPPVFWNTVGTPRSGYRGGGCAVLLPLRVGSTAAKVLILGGDRGAPLGVTNTGEMIDLSAASPQWASVESMFFARNHANAILLPDGKLLVVGGNQSGQFESPIYTSELLDLATGKWTCLCEMSIDRNYHSTGLLLPDGRVWVSGGEPEPQHRNIEIFSPGYLFEGTRPIINSAPSTISYSAQFNINVSEAITSVVLIRPGSVTHALDMEQRYIELSIGDAIVNGGVTYSVQAPANANIAPPGYYMLFVLKPKQGSLSGQTSIPSVASWVRLT